MVSSLILITFNPVGNHTPLIRDHLVPTHPPVRSTQYHDVTTNMGSPWNWQWSDGSLIPSVIVTNLQSARTEKALKNIGLLVTNPLFSQCLWQLHGLLPSSNIHELHLVASNQYQPSSVRSPLMIVCCLLVTDGAYGDPLVLAKNDSGNSLCLK